MCIICEAFQGFYARTIYLYIVVKVNCHATVEFQDYTIKKHIIFLQKINDKPYIIYV